MSINDCPDDIFSTAKHFVTKLGMVMNHYEPECHAETLVRYLHVKVTARAQTIKI